MTTKQQQYKQSAGVITLPPGERQRGATIQGFESFYDDAEQRRLLPAVREPARAVVGEVLPPEPPALYMPPPAQPLSRIELRTTYADRSRGFLLSTLPLASVAGLVAVIMGVGLAGVPLLSGAALLCFWGIFAATYLIAYLGHLFLSPDGAAFLSVWGIYQLAVREQRHRHEVHWQRYEDEREDRA